MQVKRDQIDPTTVKLTVSGDQKFYDETRQALVSRFGKNARVPGFRPGKAPAHLVEKNIDQSKLQQEFMDQAINALYIEAVQKERLRPVAQPQITLIKFVPFTDLEFTAELEAIGDVELPDYKKITVDRQPVTVTAKNVNEVLDNLRKRAATKQPVDRAAKNGDELIIDFNGVDAESGAVIEGADGKEYPLELGSNSFIPGFEDELVGAKTGAVKTFDITFPADYGAQALQNKKVTFTVTVHKVQEVVVPKLDDALAATLGPFKTVAELKADVKKQVQVEKQREADNTYDNQQLEKITTKTKVSIPKAMIDDEIDRMEEEEKRDLVYRGLTWEEHLAAEGITAEAHREQKRADAELRVKAGLVLAEIADREGITVTREELEVRLQLLKGQYPDPQMQAELDKPANRRDIQSRMLTEKTVDLLRDFSKKRLAAKK